MHEQESTDPHLAQLQVKLSEAHKTIRLLLRQLSKEQSKFAETSRAYELTVANLHEASRETSSLARERDEWRAKAQRTPRGVSLPIQLSAEEAAAIRRAMARLHHPDLGGDSERMKYWNTTFDALDKS